MKTSTELLALGLGLTEPWYVSNVNIDVNTRVMIISIEFTKGAKFIGIDGEEYTAYRTTTRRIKHLFMWQYETILEIKMPEIKDDNGKITVVTPSFVDKYSGFTYLFESFVIQLANHMPVSQVATLVQENSHTIMRIIKKYVDISQKQADYSQVQSLCIDETACKRGHNYITSMVDIAQKKVCGIVIGKGSDTMRTLAQHFENHKGDVNNIKSICIDLSPSFISGCKKYFPQAHIVFDRFHLNQFVLQAMDEVRRIEARGDKILFHKSRYLRLYNKNRLDQTKSHRLEYIMNKNSAVALAYQIKENFKELFTKTSREEAEQYLQTWCEHVITTTLHPFHQVVQTFKRHWDGILSYIDYHITNGIMEGLNGIIQAIKSRARGYKNINNFITMIYLRLSHFPIILPT